MNVRLATFDGTGDRERRGLIRGVERHLGALPPDGDLVELNFRRVEDDPRGRLRDGDPNRFRPIEPRVGEVDEKRQVVVPGLDGCRQTLRQGGHGDERDEQGEHGKRRAHTASLPRQA